MKKAFKSLGRKISRFSDFFIPYRTSFRWASVSLFLIAAFVLVFSVSGMFYSLGFWDKALTIVSFLLIAVLSGMLTDLVLGWIMKMHPLYRISAISSLMVFVFLFGMVIRFAVLSYIMVFFLASIIGISLFYLWDSRGKTKKKGILVLHSFLIVLSLSGVTAMTLWFINTGSETDYPESAGLYYYNDNYKMMAEDPAGAGPYKVLHITYGSGKDKRRPEYGQDVDVITQTIDATNLLEGWKGMGGKLRTRYFGFDASELPLNAMVWYPEGEGPFPLVLIVHGNHFAYDYSDPGYEYLGEHLASRGFIVASIDQNFLNGNHTDIFGGLGKENHVRGWLLLEHLKVWNQWVEDPESEFYGKADMQKIALAGHSRGGEAVGHAAMFNKLSKFPDDGNVSLDYDFDIKAVIAIAPSDGQYKAGNQPTVLQDVSFLTIQGSHDADVRSFDGSKMFERITFSPDFEGFGAKIYIYGANHGQFNTRWGNKDYSSPMINMFNIRQNISEEDQQRIGKFFMTAFLEAALGIKPEYRQIFYDYRIAANSLPETVYLSQYKHSGMKPLVDFERDFDITSCGKYNDLELSAVNLTDWYEKSIELKYSSLESKAVYLGWDQEGNDTLMAEYKIIFSEPVSAGKILYLNAADSGKDPEWHEKKDDNGQYEEKATEEEPEKDSPEDDPESKFIDFTIELVDAYGQRIHFPLSSFSYMQPQLEARLGKLEFIHPKPFGEAVLQTFSFKVEEFLPQNTLFNPEQLQEINLKFDKSLDGLILIDEIGFSQREV